MGSSDQVRYHQAKRVNITPKDLKIIWETDKRYWKKEEDVAELLQVCWLEVTGSTTTTTTTTAFATCDPKRRYKVGFQVSLTPDAFGWSSGTPIYVMAKRGKNGKYVHKKVCLANHQSGDPFTIPTDHDALVLEPTNSPSSDPIYFGLYEVWSGMWKGGLKIHHAFVEQIN